MKLYGRLLSILARSPFKEKVKPLDKVVTKWTVLPNDLDLFGHMNNGRYAMVMDLARVDMIARLGMLGTVYKKRWIVPVGNTQIDFKKALKPFAKYEIHTQLVYWDDTWFYFKQDFVSESHPGQVAATGYVKALFKDKSGIVSSEEVISEVMAQQEKGATIEKPFLTGVLARKFDLATEPDSLKQKEMESQHFSDIAIDVSKLRSTDESRADEAKTNGNAKEPIAIVGIGCRLPGGVDTPDQMWKMLCEGRDCITDIPSDRWDSKKFYDPSGQVPGRAYVNKGGVLTQNVYDFDPAFFGIAPREAEILDPMQRLLLEVSWEAFEDAGISPKSLAGSDTSVFVGGFMVDSVVLNLSPLNRSFLGPQTATANSLTLLANRLSYFYDFRGASVSMDTACSSSLVAVHQACQSIWNGDSKVSLVGGVNLMLTPESHISMCKGQFLSPNGRCNTFGSGADGYVRGEGSALLVLKPLSQAIEDGNQIYSVIKGTAVNQDGKTNGITVPNGEAQMSAMKSALNMAGVTPSQISYMEAHGTGTPVGDPIEANALGAVLGQGRPASQSCPIGSLKTNVGHMEACAGVGGLIKAALVLKNRQLVPHLHLTEVNPNIDFDSLKLRVPTSVEKIESDGPLYAGVNSFGYGGTNAHVIIESPPEQKNSFAELLDGSRPISLPISAASAESLTESARKLKQKIDLEDFDLGILAAALATQRSHLPHRAWLSCETKAELSRSLEKLSAGEPDAAIETGHQESPKLMFVYTGMGPQWWAMGRELYFSEPVYKDAIDECDAIFKSISGWSLLKELLADEEDSKITQTQIAQPANFAVQVGLTRLLSSWGIHADAVMGHSIGEVGSAWASGGLDLEQALTVAYHRSRLQATTAGKGGMLAVGLSESEAKEWVKAYDGKISIAAINSPSAITLAGELAALEDSARRLDEKKVFNKFLKVEVPYHSPIMNEIEHELKRELEGINATSNFTTSLYSSVTGEPMKGSHNAAYWWRNVREPVSFAKTCEQALKDGFNTFIEIGPHPVLGSSIREVAKTLNKKVSLCSSLVRKEPEQDSMWNAVGKLYCAGVDLDWPAYFGRCSHIELPRYAWNKSLYRFEGERTKQYRLPQQGHPLVTRKTFVPTPTWHIELNAYALPYVQDHIVGGSILFPGAGYVELGLALAQQNLNAYQSSGITLERIEFLSPSVVYEDESVGLAAVANAEDQSFAVHYKRGESEPVLCAKGQYFSGQDRMSPAQCSSKHYQQVLEIFTHAQELQKQDLYDSLEEKGLVYGPAFQAVNNIRVIENEVLAQIALPEFLSGQGYCLHPVLLDAALHSLIAGSDSNSNQFNVVPMGIDRLQWFGHTPDKIIAHGRIVEMNRQHLSGDIDLFDEAGNLIVRLEGLNCRVMVKNERSEIEQANQWSYKKVWEPLGIEGQQIEEQIEEQIDVTNNLEELATSTFVIHKQLDDKTLSVSQGLPDSAEHILPQAWTNKQLREHIDKIGKQGRRVSLFDLRLVQEEKVSSTDIIEQSTALTNLILNTIQSLASADLERYSLFTHMVAKVDDHDEPNLNMALPEGLIRTAMTECPQLKITLVDIDEITIASNLSELRNIWEQISYLKDEQELAIRSNNMFGLRIEKEQLLEAQESYQRVSAQEVAAYELQQLEKGKIESLEYVEADPLTPREGELVVKMVYSSLHFKDLMKALGLLSDEALKDTLLEKLIGMEGSAIVESVGEGISDLKPGDRVYIWGPVMDSHVCVPRHSAVKISDQLDMDIAAHFVTYFTVYHSFVEMAKVQSGETILIHSATGGVGLAAINLARYLGAKVIATAGSEKKREYLRSIGIEQVADSRSLSFVDDVKLWTGGKGVDVVLNFTPGEIMHKSIDCLAKSGRFIELGKQSFDRNERISLRPFTENLSYFAIDIDRLTKQRPMYICSLVEKIMTLLIEEKIEPLPCQYFKVDQIVDAFKTMSRGDYIGKLGIHHDTQNLEVISKQDEQRFSKDASYLITGGLGGFGLQVAEWMSQEGAGHLILLSRSGPKSDEAKEAIERMYANGTTVSALSCDVSDAKALKEVMSISLADMPPLKGVMHAAMVLDDKMIGDLDETSLRKVVEAKAKSAWNLHQLTQSLELDFMVLFSSISSLIGNAGQANYVAANNFLDVLAQYRRSKGLAATSINWGVFQETGVVARNDQLAKHLSHIGITPFTSQQATRALGAVLQQEMAQVGIMDVDWLRFDSMLAEGAGKSRLKTLANSSQLQEGNDEETELLKSTFVSKNAEERQEIVREALCHSIAAVLRMKVDDLKPSKSLRDLGLDSLMAVEIDVEFSSRTGLDIPSSDIASGPTVEELEERLLKRLNKMLPVKEEAEQQLAVA